MSNGPKNVTIQPRNKPPKPGEALMQYHSQNSAALTSAVIAQGAEPLEPAVDGVFPEVDQAALLSQIVLPTPPEVPAAQATGATGSALGNPADLQNQDRPRPPHTRAEYAAQQQAFHGPYPEVIDLFMGRAGVIPETGILKVTAPPAPQPVQRVEHVIKHELPDKQAAYKFVRETSAYLDGTMVVFHQNQIVYDVNMIDQLLLSGCDSLVPCEVAETFMQCPACRHQFPPSLGQRKQ